MDGYIHPHTVPYKSKRSENQSVRVADQIIERPEHASTVFIQQRLQELQEL